MGSKYLYLDEKQKIFFFTFGQYFGFLRMPCQISLLKKFVLIFRKTSNHRRKSKFHIHFKLKSFEKIKFEEICIHFYAADALFSKILEIRNFWADCTILKTLRTRLYQKLDQAYNDFNRETHRISVDLNKTRQRPVLFTLSLTKFKVYRTFYEYYTSFKISVFKLQRDENLSKFLNRAPER